MHRELPLLLAIERLAHHDDDRMEHLVRIGIGGRADPLVTAVVESDFFETSRLQEVTCYCDFDVPERVRDLLIFKVFEVLYPELLDGQLGAEWPVYDARRWIETQFLTSEAETLLAEFAKFIDPGKPIDWRIGSMFIAVRLSKDKS